MKCSACFQLVPICHQVGKVALLAVINIIDFFLQGILMSKGVRKMQVKSWLVTLGVGAAAGAVAAMMLPKHSTARRLVNKAAYAVEDAAMMVGDKISDALDM